MSISDFESDPDYSQFGVKLDNDEQGNLIVNAEKNEEFDPRIMSDVEGLLFLGRLTHECTIFGHHFILRTLTRGEKLAATQFIKDYEDSLGLADALQTAYLSLAIAMVDHRPLSIAISPDEKDPIVRLQANFNIVQKWYDPVLEALYVEYTHLIVRQSQAFDELESKFKASRVTP